ncbi:MAG: hypothetical protein Q4Q13_07595 [Vagococcus sp.]|nr:hypothetical protein [Vagococcus sp.]
MRYFEPEITILTASEFTDELIKFKQRENNDLCILEEGMSPLVELEGKKYRCQLESPQLVQSKNPIVKALSFRGGALGYKFVYFYEVE